MIAGRVYRQFKPKGRGVILRAMEWDDTDKLLRFINGLVHEKQRGKDSGVFTGFEEKLTRDEEADWVADQLVQLENKDMVGVVAEVEGSIVGVGQISRGHYRETRHHGELGLTVLGSYRGMGIGREMVKVLLREAKRIGLKSVDVEFLATNGAAARVYERAGFREVGRIPGKVNRERKLLDSMIMACKL